MVNLLAWQRLYIDLFEHPKMGDLKNVTFETNTTQLPPEISHGLFTESNRFEVLKEKPKIIYG